MCKCNLSAGPASARKLRAPLPGTRGGALRAGRRPVNQRRLTENQTPGRPAGLGPAPSPRLRAPLAARPLCSPSRRARPAGGLSLSSTPPAPLRFSQLPSFPPLLALFPGPPPPDRRLLTSLPSPGEQRVKENHPILRQPVGGRLRSPRRPLGSTFPPRPPPGSPGSQGSPPTPAGDCKLSCMDDLRVEGSVKSLQLYVPCWMNLARDPKLSRIFQRSQCFQKVKNHIPQDASHAS